MAGGHEVNVVAFDLPAARWELDGVQVRVIRNDPHRISVLAGKHDIVVSHFGDGGTGVKVARWAGKPSVQMVHGYAYRAPKSAALVVFNSHASADACIKRDRWIVCRPPVHAAEHRVARTGEHYTLVNCSTIKGVDVVERIAQKMTGRPFLGVLGGYDYQYQPEHFPTVPTQSDMRYVWSQTRVLLMPSRHETWGMVGVEAMCSGIPVIAHPTPGLRESLGDAGIFVDRDDIGGWVDAIERLDDPHEYEQASRAARARSDELDPTPDLERFTEALAGLV